MNETILNKLDKYKWCCVRMQRIGMNEHRNCKAMFIVYNALTHSIMQTESNAVNVQALVNAKLHSNSANKQMRQIWQQHNMK